jgi:hypothetical protein
MHKIEKEEEKGVNKSQEISLKDIILKFIAWRRFILSKWKIILLAGIVGGGLGFAYALSKKTAYKAELSFALEDSKAGGGGLSGALGIASQFGINLGGGGTGGEFSGDNLLELMKSRAMVQNALLTTVTVNGRRETLATLYINFNKLRRGWQANPALRNIEFLPGANQSAFTLKQDSILGIFHKTLVKGNFKVDKVDKKLSIITLTVISTNELFSKDFAEALEKVVSDFYIQTKTERESKNVAILQKQTDSVRRELNNAISGVALSTDAAPNPNPLLQTLQVPSQRKQVDVQANVAILTELVKNLELAKMTLLQETPLIQVIDKPILPLDKTKLGKSAGIIMGGFVASFLVIFVMTIANVLKNVLSEDE